MRRLLLLACVLELCIGTILPGTSLAAPSAQDTLSGWLQRHAHVHVVDSRGRSLAGAYVIFTCLPKPKYGPEALAFAGPEETTDRSGWALLYRCNDDADVILEASAPGFAPRQMSFDHADSVYEISLVRGASIRGRLLRDGRPLVNAPVALVRASSPRASNELDGQATTDRKGRYAFRGITPELPYWVYVPVSTATQFGTVRAESIRAGRDGSVVTAQALQADSGHTVAGRIVMPPGSSLVGQWIRLRLERWVGEVGTWNTYRADAVQAAVDTNGVFEFRGVPEERVRIVPEIRGFSLDRQLEAPLEFEDWSAVITVRGDHRNLKLPMNVVSSGGELTWPR